MEPNNFDRAEDTERKLREISERPKNWIEGIEKQLEEKSEELNEKRWRTQAEKIKVQIRDRRELPVERLGDESFRVRSKDIDARSEDIIILPSGEKREITWAIPESHEFGSQFWIYFVAPKS